MAPTTINIQGKAQLSRIAERAKLDIEVASTDYDQTKPSTNVVTTVSSLQNQLDQLSPRLENGEISSLGPVSFYTIGSLTTSSEDEYDEEHNRTGKRLYKATSRVDIHFRDFNQLGEMVVAFSTMPFVSLQGIEWKLTEENQAALEEDAKLQALRHAINRGRAYADVIGKKDLHVVKVDDTQYSVMFSEPRMRQTARKVSSNASFGIGVGLSFEPQQVEVNATLEVSFHAE